jgi:hypothetical protein
MKQRWYLMPWTTGRPDPILGRLPWRRASLRQSRRALGDQAGHRPYRATPPGCFAAVGQKQVPADSVPGTGFSIQDRVTFL